MKNQKQGKMHFFPFFFKEDEHKKESRYPWRRGHVWGEPVQGTVGALGGGRVGGGDAQAQHLRLRLWEGDLGEPRGPPQHREGHIGARWRRQETQELHRRRRSMHSLTGANYSLRWHKHGDSTRTHIWWASPLQRDSNASPGSRSPE